MLHRRRQLPVVRLEMRAELILIATQTLPLPLINWRYWVYDTKIYSKRPKPIV